MEITKMNKAIIHTILLTWFLFAPSIVGGSPFGDGQGFCVPPAAPLNGKVSLGRGHVIVRYSCNFGYKLIGTQVAVCVSGKWSTLAPRCHPLQGPAESDGTSDAVLSTVEDNDDSPLDVRLKDQQIVTAIFDPISVDRPKIKNGNILKKKSKKKPRKKGRKRKKGRRGKRRRRKNKVKHNKNIPMVQSTRNLVKKGNQQPIESKEEGNFKNLHSLSKEERRKLRKERKKRRKNKKIKGQRRKKKRRRKNRKPKSKSLLPQTEISKKMLKNSKEIIKNIPDKKTITSKGTETNAIYPQPDELIKNKDNSKNQVYPEESHQQRVFPSSTMSSFVTSKANILKDIVKKVKDPTRMGNANLFDLILKRRLKKERQMNEEDKPVDGERENTTFHVVPKENDIIEDKPPKIEKNISTKDKSDSSSHSRGRTSPETSDRDYEAEYEAFDPLSEGYPDEYNTNIPESDSSIKEETNEHAKSHSTNSEPHRGYPAPEERLYDENEVLLAKERYIEEENIEFSELDSTCEISNLDSLYLPPPRVHHGHVTAYTSVTNPAHPNNVYVEAVYECDFGFHLTDPTSNRLFCRKNKWIGLLPECQSYETDVDICGSENGGCEQICRKEIEEFRCSCYRGFTLQPDGKSCQDVDECLVKNGGCEGACFNKIGSHQCYCPKGFRLTTNGKTCVDKNECILRNGHGPCDDTCYNTEGSYYCTCDGIPGTRLGDDKHTCEDLNECQINNGGCSHICLNTFRQSFCSCPEGYLLGMDWKTCEDINECDFVKTCEHGCLNTPGTYRCTGLDEVIIEMDCKEGFRYNEKKKKCQDINECKEEDRFGCSHICENTKGSAYCSCPTGHRLLSDSKTCEDIDECLEEEPCYHSCENTDGSFYCHCSDGFILSPDDVTCIDINECASDNGNCSHICTNSEGSFSCACKSGFRLLPDGESCEDIDECDTNNGGCDQVCSNSPGGHTCSCLAGYELEADSFCTDIDECVSGESKCLQKCENVEGSYECFCHEGYELHSDNITCLDIDECGEGNECSHFCTNKGGSYFCECPPSWTLDEDGYTCVDINECETDNGGCSDVCENQDGGYRCLCPDGYELISEGNNFETRHLCVDVDECKINNGNCSHHCMNEDGAFSCKCPEGMAFLQTEDSISNITCQDINECKENNGGCSHRCINVEQSFHCQCPKGFQLNSNGITCDDIDECLIDNGGCSHTCVNLPATYECTCPTGWDIDYDDYDVFEDNYIDTSIDFLWKKCIDINECEDRNGGCSHECVNEDGTFFCKCPKGFSLVSNFSCTDINECAIDNGGCSSDCINTDGSFKCLCPEGFELKDSNRCVDIDECDSGIHKCSHTCINELGKYRCSCLNGFTLADDNSTCIDFNECGEDNGGCSHTCHNVLGKYSCSCPKGFFLGNDSHTCFDTNECNILNGNCSYKCLNSPGSYSCLCPEGMQLSVNKLTCLDVDECGELNNGGCSHQCKNNEGHYTCLCPSGMSLAADNHTCEDINECLMEQGGCSDECKNLDGGYECLCPLGYTLGLDDRSCEDADECLINNGGCSHICHNTKGSFRCDCPPGYTISIDGITCVDVDECRIARGGCSHSCENTPGSFLCTCPPGYSLDINKYRCIDLNECERSPCEHECFNSPGSYYCACKKGFQPSPHNPRLCQDEDECMEHNAGCSHNCFNTIGSYYCKCDKGYILASDGHSCESKPVFCPLLVAPIGGEITCSHDLHGGSYPQGTVCTFSCSNSLALHGHAERKCSSSGKWSNEPVTCQAIKCPPLTEVDHGRIAPSRCYQTVSGVGHKCYLTCSSGYKVIGNPVRQCSLSGSWGPDGSTPFCEKDTLIPFIQCPNDVTVDLAPHQEKAYVRLPAPKSNVDWYRSLKSEMKSQESTDETINADSKRFVEAHPEWAKQLESDLPAGRTTVTFMANSPISEAKASCSFVVFVRDKESPQVFGCPKSFNVYLSTPSDSEEVTWKEPLFKDNVEVVHIYKSMEPGRKLSVGTYPVHYIAVDPQGNRAKCSFVITVEAAPPVQRVLQPNLVWVVCPGMNKGNPIQMNVWRVPQACTVVNPSTVAPRVHWDSTLTHLEAPGVNRVEEVSLQQKSDHIPGGSAFDALAYSNAYSYPNNADPGSIISSATSFSASQGGSNVKTNNEEDDDNIPILKTRHSHGFEQIYGENSPFAGLFRGSHSLSLAHARARGGGGKHETTAFTHTRAGQNTQAIAHAQARIYNYG